MALRPYRRFRQLRPVSERYATPFGRGRASIRSGQVEYTWNGRTLIEQLSARSERALELAAADALEYWTSYIWSPQFHPDMTGKERDAGRFYVERNPETGFARLVGTVEMSEEYPIYEEFGTSKREGHFPLRRTMDWVAPRIREHLKEEMASGQ